MKKRWGKDVLAKLRLKKGLSQQDLAALTKQSVRWVTNHESKLNFIDPPEMHSKLVMKLAEVLGVAPEIIRGESPEPPPNVLLNGNFTIPRVSGVAASDFEEYPVDLMNREGVPGQLFPYLDQDPMVLRVVGPSMIWDHPEAIHEGDDVIFANALEEEIPENAIVVARHALQGTQTVKRVHYLDETWLELVPQNPTFHRKKIRREDVILRAVKVIITYPYKRK